MRLPSVIVPNRNLAAPERKQVSNHLGDCMRFGWREIPCFAETRTVFEKRFREHQVSGKRIEDVLPGPDSMWIPQYYVMAADHRSNQVWNQAIFCPIAAPDHVSSPGCRHRYPMLRIVTFIEEGVSIRSSHQFRAAFAAAVWIITTHRLIFSIAPNPITVLVAFIRCDSDNCSHPANNSNRFQQVHQTHHIRGKSIHWILIRFTY